jgi:hypothetical protein
MGTRVLLAAELRPELGISGADNGLPVVDIRHPDAFEASVHTLAADDGQAIVACSRDDFDAVRLLLTHARVRQPDLRAAIEVVDGTPLALSVIASLVDDLSSHDDPDSLGWQLSALDQLRATSWSAVWLPSVSRLARPNPSPWQHLRSWLPGSGFLAVHDARPRVLSLTESGDLELEPRPDAVLIHAPSEAPAWVLPKLTAALQAQSTNEVVAVRNPVDSFGTPAALEVVAIPADFVSLSRTSDVGECAGCGVRHARTACPFCGMVRILEGAHP